MVSIKLSGLLLLVIGFCQLNYCYGLSTGPDQPSTETKSQDEPVPFMTTLEPIESSENKKESCTFHDNCEDCYLFNCIWVRCLNKESSCLDISVEMCPEISCNSSTTPKTTTSKKTSTPEQPTVPTTSLAPTTDVTTSNSSTTESSATTKTTTTTSTTSEKTSTPEQPTTPTTSLAPTTDVTTESTTTENTTAPTPTTPIPTEVPSTSVPPTSSPAPPTPAPHSRHFDAASFVGGMIFVVALAGLGFAGFYYYRKSPLARNYSTF